MINECSNTITNATITHMAGSGASGSVYAGIGTYKGKLTKLAVKVMKLDEISEDISREVEYSYFMGETGNGPIVYDAFFASNLNPDFRQYIIMEYADYDCIKAIENAEDSSINVKMIKVLRDTIFKDGMLCYDIKPANFVYNKQTKQVKMIDFGGFCLNEWAEHPNLKENIEFIYFVLMCQLLLLQKNFSGVEIDTLPWIADDIFLKYMHDFNSESKILEKLDSINDENLLVIFHHYSSTFIRYSYDDLLAYLRDFKK